MIYIKDTIVHFDIFHENFICDLMKCKGACCVEGDYGAPLNKDEISLLEENLESIKPYMTDEALAFLEKNNFNEEAPDGDMVTTCINGADCIFVFDDEKGISKCAIEASFIDGKSKFLKPISCHLYPIRISKIADLEALNYNRWSICKPACRLGDKMNLPVYKFLKAPLVRKYGEDWYKELEDVAEIVKEEFKKTGNNPGSYS